MIRSSIPFSIYEAPRNDIKILIADGTLSKDVGQGIVILPKILMKSVLHNFQCNLLSISRFTKDLSCVMTFFSSYCEF
uniref:Uncharacterized protein n=1 Tax=Rhizophora mucronata TaxID=61149 RepID=A0A2P2IYY0_RHIMU